MFLLLGMLLFSRMEAQQHARYIYIQSENNQPYYVRLNGNTYSSNASGYLLIPQLNSGDYTIQLGFARSTAEYAFSFPIAQDDRGFSLKQGVDNGWSLFDMVSFNIIKGNLVTVKETEEPKAAEQKPVETKVPEQKAVVQKAAAEVKTPIPASVTIEKKTVVNTSIRKIYEKAGADGIDLVYVVPNGNKADTVILFVPHLTK
jgi:hypothetical protein